MAAIHGKGGDVTFTSVDDALVTITDWTYTASSDTANTSGMGDSFESHVPGLDTFAATTEAVAITTLDHAADIGTGASLTLFLVSGGTKRILAAAILTSLTETVSIEDVGRLSMAWVGNANTVTYPS